MIIDPPAHASPSRITHSDPCAPCAKHSRTCVGLLKRTCDPCLKHKRKCDKSRGRGGIKGKSTSVLDPKSKPPGTSVQAVSFAICNPLVAPTSVRTVVSPRRQPSPPPPAPGPSSQPVQPPSTFFYRSESPPAQSISHPAAPSPTSAPPTSDNVLAIVEETPRKKLKTDHPPAVTTPHVVADARRAVLSLESRFFSARAFFKDLQSRASGMEDLFPAQSDELEKLKTLLAMN